MDAEVFLLGLAPDYSNTRSGACRRTRPRKGRQEDEIIDLYTIVVRRVWHRYTRDIKISIEINVIEFNNI